MEHRWPRPARGGSGRATAARRAGCRSVKAPGGPAFARRTGRLTSGMRRVVRAGRGWPARPSPARGRPGRSASHVASPASIPLSMVVPFRTVLSTRPAGPGRRLPGRRASTRPASRPCGCRETPATRVRTAARSSPRSWSANISSAPKPARLFQRGSRPRAPSDGCGGRAAFWGPGSRGARRCRGRRAPLHRSRRGFPTCGFERGGREPARRFERPKGGGREARRDRVGRAAAPMPPLDRRAAAVGGRARGAAPGWTSVAGGALPWGTAVTGRPVPATTCPAGASWTHPPATVAMAAPGRCGRKRSRPSGARTGRPPRAP